MENNQLPAKITPITKELVKAKVSSELTRLNYQTLLKELVAIGVQPGNLKDSQEAMRRAKKIEREIEALRVQEKKPWDDGANVVQGAFMELLIPVRDEIRRIGNDISTVNAAEMAAQKLIDDENNRILSVRASIQSFINKATSEISDARTDSEIVRIQKLIGTEKSRKGYYGSLMPELETACENLTPLINGRKDDIRKMVELQQKSEQAIQSGDIQTATEIKEATELLGMKMEEDVLRLQDAAFEVTAAIGVSLTESTTETVKGRRLWRWKVEDIKLLAKKRPELVTTEPNAEAIDALLSERRKDGSLDKVDEVGQDGLLFYIKPSY